MHGGSNCLDERSAIAGLGPITVGPSIQNRGVGRKLMEAVLVRARERNFPGVRLLQSAFHNRSLALYGRLGFDAREPLAVMQGPSLRKRIEGCSVRPARVSDIEDCKRVCISRLSRATGIAAVFDASAGIAAITRRRCWHNQRWRATRRVVWRPAGSVDLNRLQARSYFAPLSLTSVNRRGFCVSQRVSFHPCHGPLENRDRRPHILYSAETQSGP